MMTSEICDDSSLTTTETDPSYLFDSIKTQFPFSKIRNICKLDPDLETINSDAVRLISKATEFFIEELARAAYTQAVLEKRKTVQNKDIDKVIAMNPTFEFLEDALDNWLEDVEDNAEDALGETLEENDEEGPISRDDKITEEGEEAETEDISEIVEREDTSPIDFQVESEFNETEGTETMLGAGSPPEDDEESHFELRMDDSGNRDTTADIEDTIAPNWKM